MKAQSNFHSRSFGSTVSQACLPVMLTLTVAVLSACGVVRAEDATTEDAPREKLTIHHIAPFEGEALPEPGKPFELEASVEGTQSTSNLMKLYAVKDGSLMVQVAETAVLNQYDVPQYRFSLQAPRGELHYRFALENESGELISESQSTALRRPCVTPDSQDQNSETTSETDNQDRAAAEAGVLTELVTRSRRLEQERYVYDEALVLAEQLVKELDELTPK